jgi:thiamine biosynthesis lipoprotein
LLSCRAAVVLACVLLGCGGEAFAQEAGEQTLKLFHEVHRAMGSEFVIDLYAPDAETAEQWMQTAFDEVDRLEDLLSNYRPTSELSRVSREAGKGPVTTDPETFAFLEKAVELSRRSNGAFDMTVGPLMRAWGFFFDKGRIPTEAELATLRPKIGWSHIKLDATTRTVRFDNGVSMELDPGGIGKGYAVDRVVALLRGEGVRAALISAGSSSIYGMGAPPGEGGWKVNVPDPVRAGKTMTSMMLKDMSLSTSACTEKFFIKNGHRYCHILNPQAERPVEDKLQTTVIAPSTTDSDALSTATFVMEPEPAARLVETFQGAAAVLVSGDQAHPKIRSVRWPGTLTMKESVRQ